MYGRLVDILENSPVNWEVLQNDANEFSFRWLGGDYDYSVELHGGSLKELAEEAYKVSESFDADEETSLWIGNDGHGQNGAPYHVRDILNEMDELADDLEKLWRVLKNEADKEG